ncbi:MAG TPA: hypothetical protein DCL61_05890 [Cyanobacteria bacterium UBA12227]|nr:hypothetical protein [Cyanobacteria bacterium UBA12227]HAX90301.1 hypothetical protein [Cyanobacteria bacterium UBA11370]HBY78807.1 hypothetical protein [Cyanobacteria bacterium UBA11148]
MRTVYFSQLQLKRLSKSLFVVALATIGLLCGAIPELSKDSPTLEFNSAVYAQQAVSDAEIESYAQAVLAMEPLRQQAYNEIKKILRGEVPEIQCHRPESLDRLPGEARKIARNYCDQALSLVENYLSSTRFNQITRLADQNDDLQRRIARRMQQLQNKK